MQIYHDKCFLEPIDRVIAFSNLDLKKAFDRIEEYKNKGFYLLGYVRYDAKNIFLDKQISSDLPLVYFEVYTDYTDYEPYIPQKNISIYSESELDYEQYRDALSKIKEHILKGNTYELNYTYPYKVYTNADSLSLYNYLLQKQTTQYNTYIANEWEEILSFSPELFFKLDGNKITTKPMKGTAARGITEEEDRANYNFLKNDIKNQAENVMIVDLLRNDLSKIAKTGTVNVDKLFEIEKHPTVYQMTSEISAELKNGTTLYDIFNAIFPCGSITGAPKISTMDIIEELEYFQRGVYCGAIGFISKDECIFSVPIRILQKNRLNDKKYYRYFVGGAVLWDSNIDDEWEETITKKKILDTDINFNLLETVLIKDNEVKLYDYHKKRIETAAKELGFEFNPDDFKFETDCDYIARYIRSQKGFSKIEYRKINEIKTNKIKIANETLRSDNKYLYYKTTFRPWYEYILDDYFDIIFFNEKGELTEGTRSNIVLEIDGELYTPQIESGLLNGVYRQYMLENNKLKEKILHIEDLEKADKIYCINSVRGMIEVHL